ncbi:PREDICTED: uncharacterized protein LOC104599854 [Nelumbo nucifera]|uniref:Uncharacterized protein LOC104599854 n=2 Tax=Nelumbo nucifera TaxID=4432 RepID=A0A1U8AFZ6_NELNU|nr:PREDICTED: uncharacterized protein LOC104599854 [Nelumbo nucifera]
MVTVEAPDYDCSRVHGSGLAIRTEKPTEIIDASTSEQKALYEKWECPNCMSLMIIRSTISTVIRDAIPEKERTMDCLRAIEEQFVGSTKALVNTLMIKMITVKYDGRSGVREHIMKMIDMVNHFKGMDIEISEGFLVHFIMTSLPTQFGPFKMNYNMQKEKWKMSELTAMCVQEEKMLKSEMSESADLTNGPHK